MIWATVSSQSCFCCLFNASPSLAAKNIINLILVLTIWWCPCVESSLVLLEEDVCYDQCILLAILYYPLPCFILYSRAKLAKFFILSSFPIFHEHTNKNLFAYLWLKCNWQFCMFIWQLYPPWELRSGVQAHRVNYCHRVLQRLLFWTYSIDEHCFLSIRKAWSPVVLEKTLERRPFQNVVLEKTLEKSVLRGELEGWDGREVREAGDICTHIVDWPYCATDTNITL